MSLLDEDLDDSALLCMKITQKRKAPCSLSQKVLKQTKLSFPLQKNSQEPSPNETTKESNCQLNESTSSYFVTKKSSNTCPLCLKTFENDRSYLSHMKQCAKKKDMTTRQLLDALELQKKQMAERRSLGLCTQVAPSVKKPSKKKAEGVEDFDLALGIALSKSLETNPEVNEQKNAFDVLVSNAPAAKRKRKKILKKSVLRERSNEERQRIITEKAAVVLLDEEEKEDEIRVNRKVALKNTFLYKLHNQESHLWSLSENNIKTSWYVNDLKSLLSVNEIVDQSAPTQPIDIQPFISTLNLPKTSAYKSWEKMINNNKLSDLKGKSKDSETVYIHSVVLFAKCPNVLEKDFESIFQKYNLSTILNFLEYVYCGTLTKLQNTEVKPLLTLATEFEYGELIDLLHCLEVSLSESSSDVIPSSITPEEPKSVDEIAIVEEEKESEKTLVEEEDIFMVDLTQSSHSTIKEEEKLEDESNVEKSFWSFIQNEKKREKLEEIGRLEEEKEISREMEKIETSMKQQHEYMQKILDEFEKEDSSLKNKLELEKIYSMNRRGSDDSTTSEVEAKENKFSSDCVVLSSDSETPVLNTETMPPSALKPMEDLEYDIPVFDPYDGYPETSPTGVEKDLISQSFITGDVSFEMPIEEEQGKMSPEYFSTPIAKRVSPRVQSSTKKSFKKTKRKRSDLSASRIVRKSLGLKKRNSTKKKVRKKEKSLAESLANSIIAEISNSPLVSTPLRNRRLIEMTPRGSRDLDFGESVTPSPNFSMMGESLIKEHLSKYGLKKNLSKNKAKKILQYIYEELHPIINTETGKVVKILPNDTPKTKKNAKKRQKIVKARQKKPETHQSKDSDSVSSLDKSTDYDSDGSEFEDLNEPYTQSVPNNPIDLPSALKEYFEKNPEFHQKVLLYEPIWLEELQKNLKETFKKHFKLSDLMNYLDQKCITFRSAAQKRNNEKKNRKKKCGKSSS